MPFFNTLNSAFKWTSTTLTLTTAVANSGTVTVSYPSGFAQANFILKRSTTTNQQVILNKNENLTTSQASITYGSSNMTLTNNSGYTWPIGTVIDLQLAYVDIDSGMEVTWMTVFTGKNGAGACTLTGALVGARVLGVVNLSTPADAASSFEGVITVADQIQQSSASDLSAVKYLVLLGVDAS